MLSLPKVVQALNDFADSNVTDIRVRDVCPRVPNGTSGIVQRNAHQYRLTLTDRSVAAATRASAHDDGHDPAPCVAPRARDGGAGTRTRRLGLLALRHVQRSPPQAAERARARRLVRPEANGIAKGLHDSNFAAVEKCRFDEVNQAGRCRTIQRTPIRP